MLNIIQLYTLDTLICTHGFVYISILNTYLFYPHFPKNTAQLKDNNDSLILGTHEDKGGDGSTR